MYIEAGATVDEMETYEIPEVESGTVHGGYDRGNCERDSNKRSRMRAKGTRLVRFLRLSRDSFRY